MRVMVFGCVLAAERGCVDIVRVMVVKMVIMVYSK